jgi:DNA-binding MarR family transcriptional regulator
MEPSAAQATPEAILEVEEEISALAQKIRTRVREVALAIDPALPPFGLKLLRLLARLGPTHASVAADILVTDRSIISRQVKQLEELGLVELRVDENDGRARFIVVTPMAQERLAAVVGTGQTLLHGALEGWPEADLHQFAAYIKRLNTSGL